MDLSLFINVFFLFFFFLMIRRPPRSTRTDTLFPYTTLFRSKLAANPRLREYVQERLSGQIRRPDGSLVVGPVSPQWIGRNKPHRKDRRWVSGWSPEQIANRIKLDFPDDDSMPIRHEAIYPALFIESRGALTRELTMCLGTVPRLPSPRRGVTRGPWP